MTTQSEQVAIPEWFGVEARANAFFPVMMSVYLVFYSAWWAVAWGWLGVVGTAVAVIFAGAFLRRGVQQIRHAAQFEVGPGDARNARINRAMGVLNSVTHPVWMITSVVLLLVGQGRWVLPEMVFVIGAHFVPMASILGRRIDWLLGPVAMLFAVLAAALAADQTVPWTSVFAVAGIGGAASTASYAVYMSVAYRKLCARAGVPFPG